MYEINGEGVGYLFVTFGAEITPYFRKQEAHGGRRSLRTKTHVRTAKN